MNHVFVWTVSDIVQVGVFMLLAVCGLLVGLLVAWIRILEWWDKRKGRKL